MATQSISSGITYAEKQKNFQSVLNLLPDNTQKLITPRDVRDSVYTTWDNIVYKPMKVVASDIEFIGMDQDDLKEKVYFGKKRVSNQDIMSNELLNEDVDFYFYNTKSEPQSSYDTKLAFLAGTGSFFYEGNLAVPYIESKSVQNLDGNYLNLEIRNTSYMLRNDERFGGDININSVFGNISLNGFVFPKLNTNLDATNNNKFLKFVWDETAQLGFATWSESTQSATLSFGESDIFFTSTVETPQSIGGILQGETFDKVPVTEMVRRILYPYVKPTITANFNNLVLESGNPNALATQQINYKVTKTATYSLIGFTMDPSGGSPNLPSVASIGSLYEGFIKPTGWNKDLPDGTDKLKISRLFTVSDPLSTVTVSTSFDLVLPWYYGTSTILASTTANINSILAVSPQVNKLTPQLITSASTRDVVISTSALPGGKGCIYFGYPASYPDLTDILALSPDYSYFTSFKKFEITNVQSPQNWWGGPGQNRTYKFYIYTAGGNNPTLTTVGNLSTYRFKF